MVFQAMSFRGIGQSINPMKAAGQGGLLPARLHRFDELPPVYSWAGCSPAEPASASTGERQFKRRKLQRQRAKNHLKLSQILSSQRGTPQVDSDTSTFLMPIIDMKFRHSIKPGSSDYRRQLNLPYVRTCRCGCTHINCLTAKEWLKSQLGVWQFMYESRDVRDKTIHPATFPISLARRVIEQFTHRGELVLDPFVGSGTTLVAAQDCYRNAIGFDLQQSYIDLCVSRIERRGKLLEESAQIAVQDDARHIPMYLEPESVSLIWTSPPYANLLNRPRKNKSRRDRNNEQLGKIEQYSQDPRDLGILSIENYTHEMGDIFENLLPFLKSKGHCVINVPDMWMDDKRITIHISLVEELRKRGYELRNIIIWDRTNIVNKIGIFGWPSNYITMGVTFEYLLDFLKPIKKRREINAGYFQGRAHQTIERSAEEGMD